MEVFLKILMAIAIFLLGVAGSTATLMLGTKPNLLDELSLDALRKGRGIKSKSFSQRSFVFYDKLSRVVDVLFSSIGLFALSPVLLTCSLMLFLLGSRNIYMSVNIIGKNQEPIHIYKFNSVVHENIDSGTLAQFKHFIKKTSLDRLPVFVNILRGEITLFGLARIPYSYFETLETYYPELLEQYSGHSPAIIDLYVFEKLLNDTTCKSNELLESLRFTNGVFLRNRSFRLWKKMFAATIVSVIKSGKESI